jgi:type III pantothenate kinase
LNLVIDIGNTAAKLAVFGGDEIIEKVKYNCLKLEHIELLIKKYPLISKSLLSSVANYDKDIELFLKSKTQFTVFNSETKIPISNQYKTPETLGKDRLAAAIGANLLHPNKNVLVVDVGTCIKYDFVDENNVYNGGAISPGISMRYKALHHFTNKLPLVPSQIGALSLIGVDTITSIQSGVQIGVIAEIEGMIKKYRLQYPSLICLLTGGGAQQLQLDLNLTIFAAPNLVLQGLNSVLNIN